LDLRKGDLAAAFARIAPSSAKFPGHASVLAHRARLHRKAGEHARALDLAVRALEADGGSATRQRLRDTFGADAEYQALEEKAARRVDALFGLFEEKYDYQRLRRDNVTTLWILGTLGARKKDRDAVPRIVPFLTESPFEETRASAADNLWHIGDRRAVPAMVQALKDPSLKVRGSQPRGWATSATPRPSIHSSCSSPSSKTIAKRRRRAWRTLSGSSVTPARHRRSRRACASSRTPLTYAGPGPRSPG
jgi:hypothetical protein